MRSPLSADHAALAERLLARSVVTDGGCRRWTGAHEHKGYGQIQIGGKVRQVHIVAHELWIGPIPDGYEVDHVHASGCRHRDCFEPAHLEAVTHAENVRRATALRTHCRHGHEYTPENTWWRPPRRGSAVRSRRCRQCFNDSRVRRGRKPRARDAEASHA